MIFDFSFGWLGCNNYIFNTSLLCNIHYLDNLSVHTFFTGLRGVIAPVVAFQLARVLPLGAIGWLSAGLILIGSCVLLPEIRQGRTAQAGEALVEEVPD